MKKISVTYGSAIVIIIILITLSQAAIQLTLQQETVTRSTATLMSVQELRTQRILRSSLMLLAPNPMDKSINPLQVRPDQQLSADLAFVAQTQGKLTSVGVPISGQMQAIASDYQAMEDTGHTLLADHVRKDKKGMLAALAPMFQHEQKYLQGTFAASTSLTQQADSLVNRVQWLEITIYVINLLVIAFEVFWVVLPAYSDQNDAIADLRAQIGTLQEAMNAKRASTQEGPA